MKLLKNIGKRIVACPSCKKRLRVPVKAGKTLRITCVGCNGRFNIKFTSPIMELFQWYPGLSFSHNIQSFLIRVRSLPFKSKVFCVLLFAAILSGCINLFSPSKGTTANQLPVNSETIVY